MGSNQLKARVFISCGQRPPEMLHVQEVASVLNELGFEPYIAVNQHSLAGVKENIFHQLERSEYFLFIDFPREEIADNMAPTQFRGSLFTNQELAIASYLDIPSIGFQQDNVIKEDGILRFVQFNLIKFGDPNELPDLVRKAIRTEKWDSNWKNSLNLEYEKTWFDDIGENHYRVFHFGVRNLHKSKTALNCIVTLDEAVDYSTGQISKFDETIDVKWEGVPDNAAVIVPNTVRYFDGCRFFYSEPGTLRFFLRSNYGNKIARLEDQFKKMKAVLLHFVVYSENFPPASAYFRVSFDNTIDDVEILRVA